MSQIAGKQIKDGTITTAKVGNSQITTEKININADLGFGGNKATNLGTPTSATDAATKGYVDSVATGLDVKKSVRAASTANVAGTYNATGGSSGRGQLTGMPDTLDGVTLAGGDRILLKDQTSGAQNGIWVISTLGSGSNGVWDRATDFDADAEVTAGAFTFVEEGTTNADKGFVLTTNDPITIGGSSGTALSWTQFSEAGGGGAPTNAQYVVVALDGTLSAERRLQAESSVLSLTDAGANGDITVGVAANGITDAKIRQGVARSVIGRAGNSTGNVGDIQGGGSGTVLRDSGTGLSFSAIQASDIPDKPVTSNKAMAASNTSSDFDEACSTTIAATPSRDGYVRVFVNGIAVEVGDGVKTKACFFSADAGSTARSIANIASGDKLHWVGSVAGYQLATSDRIDFDYVA